MGKYSLVDKCKVNTNKDTDVFVGIKCENNDICVNFPLGFDISGDENELRKDILLLVNTIKLTTSRKDAQIKKEHKNYDETAFPIQAYMSVIYDFYARGYYKEYETVFNVAKRGKIDWNRTIKTQRAYIQGKNAYYLEFATKKNTVKSDEIITLVHQFCVYESFLKIGWLFTEYLPEKPALKFNAKLFRSVIRDKLAHTFIDKNKSLFLDIG